MPLFFSLAIHKALVEVKEAMCPGGSCLHSWTTCTWWHFQAGFKSCTIFLATKAALADIRVHSGKTRNVWNEEGIKILGTPVGSHQFVSEVSNARVEEEIRLWEAVSWVPDIQCAWQILLQCTGPRCHHYLRTIPPSQSETYADGHDGGMWRAFEALMGRASQETKREAARRVASLPMRLGGLGFRSARRMAPVAYWALWADCLSMLSQRLPDVTEHIIGTLAEEGGGESCLTELCTASRRQDRCGFAQHSCVLRSGEHIRKQSTRLLNVMSTASCARSSLAGTQAFMSRNLASGLTVAPVSRHTLANVRSGPAARTRSRPDLGHAARCLPNASNLLPHSQLASVSGRGRRNLLRMSVLNRCGSTLNSGAVGVP